MINVTYGNNSGRKGLRDCSPCMSKTPYIKAQDCYSKA